MTATAPTTVVSRHVTSEGVVTYVRTASGTLQVRLHRTDHPVEVVAEGGVEQARAAHAVARRS